MGCRVAVPVKMSHLVRAAQNLCGERRTRYCEWQAMKDAWPRIRVPKICAVRIEGISSTCSASHSRKVSRTSPKGMRKIQESEVISAPRLFDVNTAETHLLSRGSENNGWKQRFPMLTKLIVAVGERQGSRSQLCQRTWPSPFRMHIVVIVKILPPLYSPE